MYSVNIAHLKELTTLLNENPENENTKIKTQNTIL